MNKRILKTALLILEILPAILTFGGAAYVIFILNKVSPLNSSKLLNWVLGVLGLLAISGLAERFGRLTRIEDAVETIPELTERFGILTRIEGAVETIRSRVYPTADNFFSQDFPDHRSYFQNAKHIWVAGTTLYMFTKRYANTFRQKVTSGCELRFLVINPDGPGVNTASARNLLLSSDQLREELGRMLENITYLSRESQHENQVSVRTVNYDLTFGISLIDAEQPDGVILVGFYAQHGGWEGDVTPAFELRRSRDPYWYECYLRQFEEMWGEAQPYGLCQVTE